MPTIKDAHIRRMYSKIAQIVIIIICVNGKKLKPPRAPKIKEKIIQINSDIYIVFLLFTYLSSIISLNVLDFLLFRSCSSSSYFFTSTTLSIMCSTRFLLDDFQLSKFCKNTNRFFLDFFLIDVQQACYCII